MESKVYSPMNMQMVERCYRVYESCENTDQLAIAHKYTTLAYKQELINSYWEYQLNVEVRNQIYCDVKWR